MAIQQPNTLESPDHAGPINTILTQEANRIGADIHAQPTHTSPWIDLIRQSTFPEGMGYTLSTLVYDRSLPLSPKDKDLSDSDATVGLDSGDWAAISGSSASSHVGFTDGQQLTTAAFGSGKPRVNTIDFTRILKSYSLKRAVIESPRINVEELRFAAHRTEQLRAIMDLLKEATRNSWENRYREEYGRLCDNTVLCKTASSQTVTGEEDTEISAIDVDVTADDGTIDIDANISNKIMDDIYFRLIRGGAGSNAYGRENGRPVFSVVLSSEASYQLMTEAGFRDDVRYNNARVSELIAPLGVEKSFRGFYHLCDDLAPRFSTTLDGETLTDVLPYKVNTTLDTIEPNAAYETADIEAAFILVDGVMESLIPAPLSGSNGLKFDPVNYKGEFKWTNIADEVKNPDGTNGFFRGILASASKPIKTNFGYVILFKRTSTTPAA